jgi:hypothetical protein
MAVCSSGDATEAAGAAAGLDVDMAGWGVSSLRRNIYRRSMQLTSI